VDECGAPERFTGSKLLPVATPDGQLSPALIEPLLQGRGDEHRVQARLISITQPTEVGTVYSLAQMRELADFAHAHGLWLHVDGARISNAAVSLDCDFNTLLRQTGVDLVSFGGTKNGLLNAEAVIFMQPEQARYMPWLRKQAMQLNSKMRFISVQLTAFLRQGLWRENARQANQMARLLAEQVFALPGIEPAWPVESNAVFARVPPALIGPLQQRFPFYVWDPSGPVVRWMCSYDTQPEQVSEFVQAIRELL
jgi:threonine aldolase